MNKALQIFSDEYLERCKDLSSEQIVNFLDQFRYVAQAGQHRSKTKLISMRVPKDLLEAFKFKARLQGKAYQSLIKELMRDWLLEQKNS